MNQQQVMTCNFCNGQGWLNQHEQCPICQGSGFVPFMGSNMPAVRQQVKPKKQKKQPPVPARQQQPQPQYQQTQPVYQQQPQPGNELHIFVHDQFRQQQHQQLADIPTPQKAKTGGISIFQICCIGAIVLTILSWGGVI